MKSSIVVTVFVLGFMTCSREEVFDTSFYRCTTEIGGNSEMHPQKKVHEAILAEMISGGIPGAMLTVGDTYGYASYAMGYADLASMVEMKPCNLTRVGSTVKTFTAVSILMLAEDGQLALDDTVSAFLSKEQLAGLENASESTIRDLLQHSSGIYNYIQNPRFQTASLNDLLKVWHPHELLHFARGKKPYFEVGSNVQYSNTNYILLGLIIEKITEQPFYEFFESRIFQPLGMDYTLFAAKNHVPEGIVRGYIDLYGNKRLINTTHYNGWDNFTADGGLLSNTYDLNLFITALFKGQLLSENSMEALLTFKDPNTHSDDGFKTSFGLGIFRITTNFGPAYIHSGDAIGYFASMVYFPNQDVAITWAANGNYGQLDQFSQSKETMQKIFMSILE